jgi:hypothetical protein
MTTALQNRARKTVDAGEGLLTEPTSASVRRPLANDDRFKMRIAGDNRIPLTWRLVLWYNDSEESFPIQLTICCDAIPQHCLASRTRAAICTTLFYAPLWL